jgi:signal transduction histidine kinase
LSNALKYCDADRPTLRIRPKPAGAGVTVDFIDNGSGIPAADRDVIFESFVRLSGPHSGKAGPRGAGLGLAICREIMEQLDGSVSYLPGQGGAAFRVDFPEAMAAAAE